MIGKINQTNRTMLFEEFNSSKKDIITLISDCENINSLSDDIIEEINTHLLVSNFEEFLEKFDPCIYSYYDFEKNKICYTTELNPNIPDDVVTVIKINKENSFFNMLLSLIDSRNSDKSKNINFKYEDILDLLTPKKIIEDLKQTRKQINHLYEKYNALDDNNPEKLEIGDKLNYRFEGISKNYNNILAMLPLAIEDIGVRLELNKKESSKQKIEKIKPGILSIGQNGGLQVLEINTSNELLQIDTNQNNSNQLSEIFKNDYLENSKNPNEYVANLISRSFAPLNSDVLDISVEKEIENYNNYLELYKSSQEEFIKVAKELMRKILGVKLFFDQYNVKSKNMTPKLLITNIGADSITNHKNIKALEVYLNTVNNKNDFENTVWFSILPNINFETRLESENIKQIFSGNRAENLKQKTKFKSLLVLANILEKYKIQLFFSFHADENTDFKSLSINGIDGYKNQTKVLENKSFSEYLVCSLPNFTLVPKNRSKILIGEKIIRENENESMMEEVFFYINGIYIDSCYIACGITSSYQCPNYLKERFQNVSSVNPGVRLNIESEENNFLVLTTMPKEISGYTNDIKNKINELNYGFVFSSDNAVYKNKFIDNISVYKARSLSKNTSGVYEPIYKTLTCTYIERILRYETSDFKEDRINYFFSNSPNSMKTLWTNNSEYINAILKKEDDMSYSIDTLANSFNLNLSFSGAVKHLKLSINANK